MEGDPQDELCLAAATIRTSSIVQQARANEPHESGDARRQVS
jgi:hypothetical protein